MISACVLIPIYNNKDTIERVVDRVAPLGRTCLIVDDGSDEATKAVLQRLAADRHFVRVKHLPENGGKGAAVMAGLFWAESLGFSHALQVDADGQHRIEDGPRFLQAAGHSPEALVLGCPLFDETVPKARLHGRKLSVYLVHLETLSRAIADPLFGFRVYPVAATADVLRKTRPGTRMDFDPEIAVRLYWHGLAVVNIPTPVFYPEGGTSHFHMVRDNLRISWLHTRLTFGMILRLPRLLLRPRSKRQQRQHHPS